jgi:hypothetical protein
MRKKDTSFSQNKIRNSKYKTKIGDNIHKCITFIFFFYFILVLFENIGLFNGIYGWNGAACLVVKNNESNNTLPSSSSSRNTNKGFLGTIYDLLWLMISFTFYSFRRFMWVFPFIGFLFFFFSKDISIIYSHNIVARKIKNATLQKKHDELKANPSDFL